MATTNRKRHGWSQALLWIGLAVYGVFIGLFGWQTWEFVNWLFPSDQLLARILTMFSFDVMAALWAIIHTFYHFANRGAKIWVMIAWVLTFVFSLVASILYLVVQFYFRFNIGTNPGMVNFGYAVCIIALVFNILALMAWLVLEYRAYNPRQDEFISDGEPFNPPLPPRGGLGIQQPQHAALAQSASTRVLTDAATGEMYAVQPDGAIRPLLSAPSSQNGAKPAKSEQEWKA